MIYHHDPDDEFCGIEKTSIEDEQHLAGFKLRFLHRLLGRTLWWEYRRPAISAFNGILTDAFPTEWALLHCALSRGERPALQRAIRSGYRMTNASNDFSSIFFESWPMPRASLVAKSSSASTFESLIGGRW
jgi:hypothetical protein